MYYLKKYWITTSIIIILAVLVGCQPNVRFATKKAQVSTKASSSKKSKLPENKEDIEKIDFLTGNEFIDALINEAEKWLGVPYKYGGESKNGVDCSGFVMKVFSKCGTDIPRTSSQQYDVADYIDFTEKKPGDLLFFKNKGTINHVGIYLGQGYMIHASTSSGVIKQSIHDSYFMNKLSSVGRITPNYSKK
jgi:cell wall-associated NlpC family hydrolase